METLIQTIENSDAHKIDDLLTKEFLQQLNLPTRRAFIERLTIGKPRRAGDTSASTDNKQKSIVNILLEGTNRNETFKLIHIKEITDLITEPQLKYLLYSLA